MQFHFLPWYDIFFYLFVLKLFSIGNDTINLILYQHPE